MTSEQKGKLLSKIKKLLALQSSPNEHEAALASERVQAILAQYNLSMTEVDAVKDDDGQQITEDSELKTNSFPWHRMLANHVAKLYFCKYLYRTHRKPGGNARSGHDSHIFIGARHNIEVAKVMFDYLRETIDRLAREGAAKYVKEHLGNPVAPVSRSGYITSFTNACANRLCIRILNRIDATKRGEIKTENGTTLPAVIYDDTRVQNWMNDKYPDTKSTTSRARITNWHGSNDGRAAADKIGLDTQVGRGSKQKQISK